MALDRRVAVNLNYTVSSEVMNDCIAQCGIRHVLTSRRVMERFNLDLHVEMVYLEEEQRLAAEQRYLDWVRGVGAKNGGNDPSNSPQGTMRHGKL